MSVFIDMNILVYAHDLDAGERLARAQRLVVDLWAAETPAGISVQVLQELYVNLVRKKVSPDEARELVNKLPGLASDPE